MEVLVVSLPFNFFTRLQNIKVYRHRVGNLRSRCNLLVNAIREDGAGTISAHADAIDEARLTLESVARSVDRWAKWSAMRSFLQQDVIHRQLEKLDSRVDTCLSQYEIRMNNEITRAREEQYEAMRKDDLELGKMFNDMLISLIQYSDDRKYSPDLQIVMEYLEEELLETQTNVSANFFNDDSRSFNVQEDTQEDPLERGFQHLCKSFVILQLNQPLDKIARAATAPKIRSTSYGQPRPQESVHHSMRALVPGWVGSLTSLPSPQIPPLQNGGNVVWHTGPWTAAPSIPLSSGRMNSATSGISMSSTRSSLSRASTSMRLPTPPTPETSIASAQHSPVSHPRTRRPSSLRSLNPLETALTTRSSCYVWKSGMEHRVISKATMEGLIDYFLLTPAADNPGAYNMFFIGHLSVISPHGVFQKIKQRFEEAETCSPEIQDDIQYCTARLINDWLQNENASLGQLLLTDMKDFFSTIVANDEVPAYGIVLQIVQGIKAKASISLPPPQITSSLNPDIHQSPTPTDLAFALTKQEAEIYRRILPSEYVARACNIEDGCPNLSAALLLIRRINFWVQSSILDLNFGTDTAGLERRSEKKQFFIIVAEECYNIGNFSSFHAIVDALHSPAVAALTSTHNRMLPREQRRMKKLLKISSTLGHPPNKPLKRCIPWHNAHLEIIKALVKDLKDVDEQHNPPMLNCEKWIALSDAAMSAVQFQDSLHMYGSSPANQQSHDTAVEYLHAGLCKINPEEDITQALLLKSKTLKASEVFLRTGHPTPSSPKQYLARPLLANPSTDRTCAHPAVPLIPPDLPSTLNIFPSSPPIHSTSASHLANDSRLIFPQVALDHAIAHELSVREALEAACAASDATYMIQVGFNEDMLQSNQGMLQEIYIYVNFDIPRNDKPQVLHRLSRILSPFPCTVHTPSADLTLSIVGQDGNELASKERWTLFHSRGVFTPESNLQADGHSSPVCLKESLSTRVTAANDETCGGAGGNCSGDGGISASGHTGGVGGKSNCDQSSPMPGNNRDSDSGSGSGPEPPSSTTPQQLPVTLDVPLKTGLKIAWSQEPEIFQEFNTTSRLFVIVQDAAIAYNPFDDAGVNSGFGPYPSPTVDARFVHLHVATANQAESSARYELHLTRVRISATLCSDTLSWSPRTTPGGSDTIRKVETTNKILGGSFNIAQWSSASIFHTRGSTSGTERHENLSGIVVESSFTDEDASFIRWTYDIKDAKERKIGRDFQEPPRVKFGFSNFNERPKIGVRMIVTWSLSIPPKKSWSVFLKKTGPVPVFRNFLQDVSTSIQLDGLSEPSRIRDPMLSATSTAPRNPSAPSTMDSGMELQAAATAEKPALNYVGAKVPDVTAVFKSALYGQLLCMYSHILRFTKGKL